jgi:hypothetical protein
MKLPAVRSGTLVGCLTLAFLAGCDHIDGLIGTNDRAESSPTTASASRLVGVWIAADGNEPVAGEIGQRMQQGFDQNALKLQFSEGGRLTVYRGSEPTPPGTWQVAGGHGKDLVVRLSAPGLSADEAPTNFLVAFGDENHFTLRAADSGGEGLAFTFTRQAARVAAR